MIRAAMIVGAALVAAPAQAERNPSIYPAAQCAAFWLGYADYARASAYLDFDPTDLGRANAFRAVALRLATATPAEIETYVDTQRPLMASLMEAVIYTRSRSAQTVFERLTTTCKTFGAAHVETRDLM
ncbi:MAG: hypothetical protein AAGK69_02995 [Pseudomonadota bacterium]